LLAQRRTDDEIVYTFVDPKALPSIRRLGLLSGDQIAASPKLLALARPNPKEREDWMKSYRKFSRDPETAIVFKGPSVFFSMPAVSDLDPDHPIRKRGLVPLRVRLGELMRDHPEVQVYGVELVPLGKSKRPRDREHVLDHQELLDLLNRSTRQLWEDHDPKDTRQYASNVPHGVVLTPRIPPSYLDEV
jgi:hypothetical protein